MKIKIEKDRVGRWAMLGVFDLVFLRKRTSKEHAKVSSAARRSQNLTKESERGHERDGSIFIKR